MTIDITQILLALITLAGAAVTTFLIPWLKSKTSDTQQTELLAWVQIAVVAAEQIYTGGGRGQEKLEYVTAWLENKGLRYDAETIRVAVEAAVYNLKK